MELVVRVLLKHTQLIMPILVGLPIQTMVLILHHQHLQMKLAERLILESLVVAVVVVIITLTLVVVVVPLVELEAVAL